MLISPTEPPPIQALGQSSSVPERYGVDIMWWGRGLQWGIQRKQFPGDFLSSVHDGRLTKEMGQIAQLSGGAVVLLEGYGTWTNEGAIVGRGRLTKAQLFGIIWTAYLEHKVPVIRVKDIDETVEAIEALVRWSRKLKHDALKGRPGPGRDKWGTRNSRMWLEHLVQGFPDTGPTIAAAVVDSFQGVPFRWNCDGPERLMEINGIGPKRAAKLWAALEGEINE